MEGFRPLSGYLISKLYTAKTRVKLTAEDVSVPSRGILFPNL